MSRGPGKFEGVPDEIPVEDLYAAASSGFARDEVGSVDELGWYGLIEHTNGRWYILSEDSQGFVDVEEFDSKEDAQGRWAEIEDAYLQWLEEW